MLHAFNAGWQGSANGLQRTPDWQSCTTNASSRKEKKPIWINILIEIVAHKQSGWTGSDSNRDTQMELPTAIKHFRRQQHIARPGETRTAIYRIEEGWACRYSLLPDGRRQITALYLPGDYCEPQWLLSGKAELPVLAVTGVRATVVPLATIHSKPGDGVKRLLGDMVQVLERQSRWIVSLGRKNAVERVSELLADLYARLGGAQGADGLCTIPLTQRDIADVVGLTPVHVNRVLQGLRQNGLVEIRGRTLLVRGEQLPLGAAA